jgi:hypothetical protein
MSFDFASIWVSWSIVQVAGIEVQIVHTTRQHHAVLQYIHLSYRSARADCPEVAFEETGRPGFPFSAKPVYANTLQVSHIQFLCDIVAGGYCVAIMSWSFHMAEIHRSNYALRLLTLHHGHESRSIVHGSAQ